MFKKINLIIIIGFSIFLQSCASTQLSMDSNNKSNVNNKSGWMQLASQGQKNLDNGNFDLASKDFNDALKANIQNAKLQALNAIAYHLSAQSSDATKYNLAREGYKLSSKFDPTNWMPYYLNGMINLDEKKYLKAKLNFIKAAARNIEDKNILFHLIEASYYDLDFNLSIKIIEYLKTQELNESEFFKLSRFCTIIYYASNLPLKKEACFNDYINTNPSEANKKELLNKLDMWRSLQNVKLKDNIIKVQAMDPNYNQNSDTNSDPNYNPNLPPDQQGQPLTLTAESITDERMVMVDVVIIGSTEDVRKRSGLNLLNGLNLQFGNTSDGIAAFSQGRNKSTDQFDSTSNTGARTIISALTIPAINYSLNIINSSDSNSKILAKPSLIALSGQQSTFFSGVTINGAATSGNGDPVQIEKEIGVSLSITPIFLTDEKVFLKVVAERTFLMDPSSSVKYDFRLDTTKTTVNSSVVLEIGKTLILGGLTEQQDANSLDGVPVLRDIPIVSLLFSEKDVRKYKKTITILITPKLSQESEDVSDKKKILFKSDKKNPDLLILNENLNADNKLNIKNNVNFSKYKRTIINNFVSSDNFNLSNVSKTDQIKKTIIEMARELSSKVNL
jgi:Flp pilus assembly secretin CpaC